MTNYSQEELNNVMSFDSAIENDGQDFTPLPEGDYIFEVTNFERGQYNGGAKIPPCPCANLTLTVYSEDGSKSVRVNERLMLYKTMEWKLAAFFRCIGQKKHGEKLVPDWNKVLGSTGVAHFIVNKYDGQDGKTHENNRLDKYIDADPSKPATLPNNGFQSIPDGLEEAIPFQ